MVGFRCLFRLGSRCFLAVGVGFIWVLFIFDFFPIGLGCSFLPKVWFFQGLFCGLFWTWFIDDSGLFRSIHVWRTVAYGYVPGLFRVGLGLLKNVLQCCEAWSQHLRWPRVCFGCLSQVVYLRLAYAGWLAGCLLPPLLACLLACWQAGSQAFFFGGLPSPLPCLLACWLACLPTFCHCYMARNSPLPLREVFKQKNTHIQDIRKIVLTTYIIMSKLPSVFNYLGGGCYNLTTLQNIWCLIGSSTGVPSTSETPGIRFVCLADRTDQLANDFSDHSTRWCP